MKFSTTVFSQTTYVTFQGVWVFEREVRRGRGERKERGTGMREEGPPTDGPMALSPIFFVGLYPP